MVAQKKSRLPSAYQEVEYLKSTGNQRIDLNTSITNDMPIFATVMLEYDATGDNVACFGGRTSGTENNVQFNLSTATSFFFDYGNYQINRLRFQRILNAFFDIEFTPYTIRVKGGLYDVTQSVKPLSEPFATPKTYLFDCYNKYSGHGWIGRIARFRLGSTRNCVPCVRKSDQKPGMYDLCGSICPLTNSPFYINAGTGDFIVGPDVWYDGRTITP